jgi:hypothetical protein
MASRVAFLLLAMAAVGASAAATCPAPSTAAVQCYGGNTASNVPAGGFCTCECGSSAASADEENDFAVASTADCTAAVCASTYATACGSASYKSATYTSYATAFGTAPALQPAASGQICYAYTATCPGLPACNGMTSGTVSKYASIDGNNAVVTCGLVTAMINGGLASTFVGSNFCNTNGCNFPGSASAAPLSLSVSFVLATAAAAAAAAML